MGKRGSASSRLEAAQPGRPSEKSGMFR